MAGIYDANYEEGLGISQAAIRLEDSPGIVLHCRTQEWKRESNSRLGAKREPNGGKGSLKREKVVPFLNN